ncbi:chemotaxis protein CheA [Paenibacillus alvei]|uniref:chemotaxis protein CheA n=1 Tax=Paenibacillus TaxID=44249 RepID=UPI0021D211E0|nr:MULTISPECIES: chemotaxis protein CheA [Paenibacillus]MCY9542573.1 chemotaxis protein CheA [Paenibacillus alvei]MCY9706537.1 chemotaxis protein CheA [Paenibacillus alvei]MCY9736507.1 chemotaxis protein CheA [Paenibacillus alvei]MCY9758058.1 chemotaxis protein CheA [Paenibacillus alvei]MEC0083435.1 chemotaxis protein CheA [Paenibacillus alvei]
MDLNQYLSMFIDEANDHLQALNEHMLELENQPDDVGIVQVIFRSAHTLKGMSATMGFEDLASLTHQMENVLDLVRNNLLAMDSFIFDTLFRSLDALEAMVSDITNGGEGKADVTAIVASLQSIVKGDYKKEAASEDGSSASGEEEQNERLDEFQRSILEQSLEAGMHVYHIHIRLREDCVLKAARAYMVFQVLGQYGEVVKSNPPAQDIEQDKFENGFSVFYVSSEQESRLQQEIGQVSELDSVQVQPFTLDDVRNWNSQIDEIQAGKQEAAATAAPSKPDVKQEQSAASESPSAPARKANTAAAATGKPVGNRTIRVDIERLDVLMNLLSEMLIDRVRLEQLSGELKNHDLTDTVEHLSRVSSDLQNIVLKLRMVPVDTVFSRFPRMMRDLAKSLDKKVDFIITGAETELDRTVIDEIGDPLVHLLRNAVDHGIESIEERIAAGKSETGTVHLRAFHSGNHVFIEIEEDGHGIDRAMVLKKAIKNGVVTAERAVQMSDEQVYMLLFASGFSTAEKVSDISGRGVGLDVVRSKITSLGGHVIVESKLGQGTKFIVQLPLTMSILSAMLFRLGSEKYAIPLSSIVETSLVKKEKIRRVHGGIRMVDYRDSVIPLLSLSTLFDCPNYSDMEEEEIEIIIVRKGERLAALAIDDFIGQSEIVLKPLGTYLKNTPGFSGATILGDGQVALIIDPNALLK